MTPNELRHEKRLLLERIERQRRELHHRIYGLRSSASPWLSVKSLFWRVIPFFRPALALLQSRRRGKGKGKGGGKGVGKLSMLVGVASLAALLVPNLRSFFDQGE